MNWFEDAIPGTYTLYAWQPGGENYGLTTQEAADFTHVTIWIDGEPAIRWRTTDDSEQIHRTYERFIERHRNRFLSRRWE